MCTRLQHRTCKTSRGNFASHGLSAHGLSTERARLAGGTSLRSWFFTRLKCTRLKHRTCKTSRGTLRYTRLRCTRPQHRTCKTSLGHFASLVVSKKVPLTWWDFDFFFPKNPRYRKFELDFFPIKKVFEIFWQNTVNYLFII